jgi:hypothetical protein
MNEMDFIALKSLESAAEESKEGGEERSSKRQRIAGDDEPAVKPVAEWQVPDILREEVVLSTHMSVLQVPKKVCQSCTRLLFWMISMHQLLISFLVFSVPCQNFSGLLDAYHKAQGDVKSKTEKRDIEHKVKMAEKIKAPVLNTKDPNYGQRYTSINAVLASDVLIALLSHRSQPFSALSLPSGIPIIVVPSAVSAVINMYNVKQLLEHGVFESGEYNRVQKGMVKEPLITIQKASFYDSSKTVRFQIIDDVTQLRSESDWHRVVAVFVSGALWQFKDWPTSRWANPAAIFENGEHPVRMHDWLICLFHGLTTLSNCIVAVACVCYSMCLPPPLRRRVPPSKHLRLAHSSTSHLQK